MQQWFVFVLQSRDKPLISASARGNTKIVEHLLTYGADVNLKDGVMMQLYFNVVILKWMLLTLSYNMLQRDGSTALIQACLCNHSGIVKILLSSNPKLNLTDKVSGF